ncbi:MAG: Rrf2 family transcriptional regulator [Nitrospiraceae bacterium]|nr:Rrf2 family transcriptional regulator [Nitrospiraceae bacterium]
MRVSQRVTYGIMAAVDLAMHVRQDVPVQARLIARHQGIPIRFLEQVLHSMKKAGLVESIRGAQGGYRLSRKPADLSVADIMEALDGPVFHQSFYGSGSASGATGADRLLGHVWDEVQRAERNVLEKITIDQLAARQQAIEEQRNPMYHI